MGLISLIWGVVAMVWMVIALIPLLGWGNWFLIPFAAIGAVIAAIGIADVDLQPRTGTQSLRQCRLHRARGGEQAVEVGQGLVELGLDRIGVQRLVADDRGGARQQQRHRAAGRWKHCPGETGRLRAVLARVAVGTELARVLQRHAGCLGREPVDLQPAPAVEAADRGGGRQPAGVERTQPAGAADTEAAIALVVLFADGDAVEVVPDPQQLRVPALRGEFEKLAVSGFGGVTEAIAATAVGAGRRGFAGCEGVDGQLVEFDRTELQRTVLGPGDVANAASPDIAAGPPDLQRRRPVRLQRHPQVAWVVVHRRGIAETEDGEHVFAIQYLRQRCVDVVDRQPRRGCEQGSRAHWTCSKRAVAWPTGMSAGTDNVASLPDARLACTVSPSNPTAGWRRRYSQSRSASGVMVSALNA